MHREHRSSIAKLNVEMAAFARSKLTSSLHQPSLELRACHNKIVNRNVAFVIGKGGEYRQTAGMVALSDKAGSGCGWAVGCVAAPQQHKVSCLPWPAAAFKRKNQNVLLLRNRISALPSPIRLLCLSLRHHLMASNSFLLMRFKPAPPWLSITFLRVRLYLPPPRRLYALPFA